MAVKIRVVRVRVEVGGIVLRWLVLLVLVVRCICALAMKL